MRFFLLSLLFFSSIYSKMKTEILSHSPHVILVHDFLTPQECDHLMKLAIPELQRSTVVDERNLSHSKIDKSRTSKGMFLT